jgi:diaminohydroxyphosphoribosylaminopyrimidine deaminase/5-amino-6-(5-phosphoribosylamino)uracil reductase
LENRPFVILKWAQTADGFIDYAEKSGRKVNWITDDFSRIRVHKQRATEQAILVGAETVRKDNPRLTIREWYSTQQPVRIVFAGNADDLLKKSHILTDKNKTVLVNFGKTEVNIEGENKLVINANGLTLKEVLQMLYERYGIYSVIVEGGAYTLNKFIKEGLWDEAYIYTGTVRFENGVKAPTIDGIVKKCTVTDNVELKVMTRK